MRYYHYVSDTKVDMLFQQIPNATLKGISGEIGFDVGLLKGKLGVGKPIEEGRYAKLAAVESYLQKKGLIAEEPSSNRWSRLVGEFHLVDFTSSPDFVSPDLVVFVGKTGSEQVVLCGSSAHITGQLAPTQSTRAMSHQFHFIRELNRLRMAEEAAAAAGRILALEPRRHVLLEGMDVEWMVDLINRRIWGDWPESPTMRLEALVRVFKADTMRTLDEPETLVIGSPLFVADAE